MAPGTSQKFNKGISHDRTQTFCKTRRRRSRLAEGQAPLLVRQPLRPRQYGPRLLAGVERRRDRAEHRLSRPSPRQHGNHHLCPRRRDHAPGQPRQQGPDRSRRRAGDERRKRHPSLRVQSGADRRRRSSRSGSSRPRRAASRPGAPSRFRSRIAPASSSPSPAALPATRTRCRSAPMRGCSPPR